MPRRPPEHPGPVSGAEEEVPLPVLGGTPSGFRPPGVPPGPRPRGSPSPPPEPMTVPRGVVVFDIDGTLMDDLARIADVAADVIRRSFGVPPEQGRIHYLATTGMPFEAQLAQLFPEAPAALRETTARLFHQRKVAEAYAHASPFPDVPRLLKRLASERWTLVVSTGAETEMAELLLEREGLRYWFDAVLGSGDGTKREHLAEFRRRYPGARMFLVGDSRFDMEAARDTEGVLPIGRATSIPGWTLSPEDLRAWGAAWAGYSLAELPDVLARLERSPPRGAVPPRTARHRSRPPRRSRSAGPSRARGTARRRAR
ncbi:MAG: HAD family hydrolase [Thermoplasmata archaeon]